MLATDHRHLLISAGMCCDAAQGSGAGPASSSRETSLPSSSPSRSRQRLQHDVLNSESEGRNDCNDAFQRWRPSFHVIAPKNWMNDPCGPCYDPSTGLFHLLYQYNPHGAQWGNMSWMHATSRNLVHWRHVKEEATLVPSQPHDDKGVFSGALLTRGLHGEMGQLTAVYTAVSHLPIHYTKPYIPGCEKLALATTSDYGKTWHASPSLVALQGPPVDLAEHVLSWRDPYIGEWPSMDLALGLQGKSSLYGLISGSLRHQTPTVFLYTIDRSDLSKWTFVAHLADVGMNFRFNEFSGDMGQNWEVCNFFHVDDDNFLLLNVEGVDGDPKCRHAMWTKSKILSGVTAADGLLQPRVQPQYSGIIDHGCLYAATTFVHEPTGRRLMWGWVTEDDLAEHRYDEQGWSGCMSLPREVTTITYDDVDVEQLMGPMMSHTFWPILTAHPSAGSQSVRIATLGVRPAAELLGLRDGATHFCLDRPACRQVLPFQSRTFELLLDINVTPATSSYHNSHPIATGEIGVIVAHNASRTLGTKIVFSPQDEIVVIDRAMSSTDGDVNRSTKTAPLGLVRFSNGTCENVRMRIFLDNSVLEVFVNDRIAITTRIYCDSADCNLVSLCIDEDIAMRVDELDDDHDTILSSKSTEKSAKVAHISRVEAWHGLQDAMLSVLPE